MSTKYNSTPGCFLVEPPLAPENASVKQLMMHNDPEDVAPARDTSQGSPFGTAPGGPIKSISTPALNDHQCTFSIMPSITEATQSLQALQANFNENGNPFQNFHVQGSISPPQQVDTSSSTSHFNSHFPSAASMSSSDSSGTPTTTTTTTILQHQTNTHPQNMTPTTDSSSTMYTSHPSTLPPLLQSYLLSAAATTLSSPTQPSTTGATLSPPNTPTTDLQYQQQACSQIMQVPGMPGLYASQSFTNPQSLAPPQSLSNPQSLTATPLSTAQLHSILGSLPAHTLGSTTQFYTTQANTQAGGAAGSMSLPSHLQGTEGLASGQYLGMNPMAFHTSMPGANAWGRISSMQQQPLVPPPVVPATPQRSPTPTQGTTRIKLLLSSGGEFLKNGAGQWEYFGGETRLVTVSHTLTIEDLLQDLSKANKTVLDERCQLKYALPGSTDVLIDLINDDDVDNMWDEWQTFTLSDKPTFKLHLYIQIDVSDRSRSGSEQFSDHASHRSAASSAGSEGEPGGERTSGGSATVKTYRSVATSDELGSITKDPRINLLELEGKIELIPPEDLSIGRFLGSGGYGEVYLCRWHSSDVAVKCLNPSLFSANGGLGIVSEDVVAELVKEANMLGGLRHPNVVWVYGLVIPTGDIIERLKDRLEPGETIDAINLAATAANATGLVPGIIRPPALVTEYLSGGSLHDAIQRKEAYLSSKTIKIKLMLDTARGMEYLHSKRIVHFDLKSGNLLVGFNNRTPMCKVADFGLSKQRQQTFVTGVTSMRGTLPWTAPEIIKTPTAVSEKVDVYSFGIVMWELWTLKEPFDGVNYHALLHMMSQQDGLRPALPGSPEWDLGELETPVEGWMDLMQRCWSENPDERPTFVEVVQELSAMLVTARSLRKAAAA